METAETRESVPVKLESKSLRERFGQLVKIAPTSRQAALALSLAVAGLSFQVCDEGQPQTSGQVDTVPTSAAAETMEGGMPSSQTPVVPIESTVVATPTPPKEATATAEPTQVAPTEPPATQIAEETSTATPPAEATPEVAPRNYTIEIIPPDPTKPSLQDYERYSIEETQQLIELLASKYPILGEVKFQITLGGGTVFAGQDQEERLIIRADRTDLELESKLPHEVVHSWDFVIKKQANEQLLSSREAMLSDPQIGRDYPYDFEAICTDYTKERRKFLDTTDVLSLDEFKVLTSGEANGFWISSLSFFREFLDDENLAGKSIPIKNDDPNYPNRQTYSSFADFLQNEAQTLNDSAQRNNRRKVPLEEISKNVTEFESLLIRLVPELENDKQVAYWWQSYEKASWLIIAKKYSQGELQVRELFSTDESARVELGLTTAKGIADVELLAAVVSVWAILNEQGRLPQEFPMVEEFFQAVSNSLK